VQGCGVRSKTVKESMNISAPVSRAETQPGVKLSSCNPVKRAEKPHVIAFRFQPGLKYELGHAQRLSCECKTLSYKRFPPSFKHCARAEIRHVINGKKISARWADRNFSPG